MAAWVETLNARDPAAFLRWFTDSAVLEDHGVGTFQGLSGIAEYYRSYFVYYRTVTEVLHIRRHADRVLVVVHFTGNFPGGTTRGTFDLQFEDGVIAHVVADLTD